MTRRKFEITAHMNERDFPHIEALSDDAAGVVGLELSQRHTADFGRATQRSRADPMPSSMQMTGNPRVLSSVHSHVGVGPVSRPMRHQSQCARAVPCWSR